MNLSGWILAFVLFLVGQTNLKAAPFEGIRFSLYSTVHQSSVPGDPYVGYGTATYTYLHNPTNQGAMDVGTIDIYWYQPGEYWTNLTWTSLCTNTWGVAEDGSLIYSNSYPWLTSILIGLSNGVPTGPTYTDNVPYWGAQALWKAKGTFPTAYVTDKWLTNVDCKLDLVLQGDRAGFTNDVIVRFTVSAYNADTGQNIPWTNITVDGKSPDTNGYVWKKYSEWSTNNVTPSISGASNYTFTLSETIYKMRIEADEIADIVVNTNSISVLELTGGYTNITDITVPGVIGRGVRIWLNSELAFSFTNILWTVGGSVVSNWSWTLTNTTLEIDFPKTNEAVNFTWWQTGTNEIQVQSTYMGETITRKTKYIVKKPPTTFTAASGTIAIDGNHSQGLSVHFGDDRANQTPGMKFEHNGTAELGQFMWVQTINSTTRRIKKNGNWYKLEGSNLLDNDVPYMDENPTTDSPPQPGIDIATQSPEPLNTNYSDASANDSFTMHLMYRPSANDVWVPLRKVDWGWSAEAHRYDTGWDWLMGTAPVKTVPANDSPSTGYPTWNGNVIYKTFIQE